MLKRGLARVGYSEVMASVAVFLAMGGGAYALSIPRNSVGAQQIKKNAVGASEITKSAVRSSEVRDRSLLARDFRPGQLPSGPQGPQGIQGPPGKPGTPPAPEAPHTVTSFLGGWTTYDEDGVPGSADDTPVRYWRDLSGIVHLEGAVTKSSSSDGSPILRLPEGYRPAAAYLNLPTVTTGSADFDEQLGMVGVNGLHDPDDDGTIFYHGGKTGYFSLDGISFRARP